MCNLACLCFVEILSHIALFFTQIILIANATALPCTVVTTLFQYFNFRATEYLYENGAKRFFHWFDYKVWSPLGRPVGTTIFPGMQFVAVWLKRFIFTSWTLNDVCCYVPAWFGVVATIITGLIAYECSLPRNCNSNLVQFLWDIFYGSPNQNNNNNLLQHSAPTLECAIFAMAMMSIVPAHLMRSVGGGFDNESVATTTMLLTFYCWVRSLRNGNDVKTYVLYGILTGVAYFGMVAVWGGASNRFPSLKSILHFLSCCVFLIPFLSNQ